ncbi:MAG: transporter substrate-binding domain-containing protein [bacterium]|nr:transporter substrate-binding domain-containing protein [bacterium]
MKKNIFSVGWIFVFSVFITVLALSHFLTSGNAYAEAPDEASAIAKIKSNGKLVVGTSADYPPYEFHLLNDKEGELVGIDIDIAKVIAKELGVELVIKDLIFSRIFNALDAGQIDIAIAGLHPTEERKKVADFSDNYYQAIQSIVINAAHSNKIKTIEDLRGKIVGTQKDSIQESMAKSDIKAGEFVVRETIEELIIILKKNLVDAIILEKPVADSYVRKHKAFTSIKGSQMDDVLGSAIAVKKGNAKLLKEINRILADLKKNDKINDFVQNAKVLTDKK